MLGRLESPRLPTTGAESLPQYLILQYATTWIMLLADDYHVEVGGAHFRPAILVFFLVWAVHFLGTRQTEESPTGLDSSYC